MRVAIIGNSGSGKSTLARQLSERLGAEVLDLDTVAWEPGKIAEARPDAEARADVRDFCRRHESWIIEGCYAGLVESVLDLRPHLLVIDPGVEQCLSNCRARPWEPHKYASKAEQDRMLEVLLPWVEGYYERDGDLSLAAHRALYEGYDGPRQWLTERPARDFTP